MNNMRSAYARGSITSEKTIPLHGVVNSGRGIAKRHISAELDEFEAATNMNIMPGSLNVILSTPTLLNESLATVCSNGKRLLWPARISDKDVWIYRFSHAPLHLVEILSDEHLRSKFDFDDGDQVYLEVNSDICVPLSIRQWCAWQFIWRGRENWSNRNYSYYSITRRFSILVGATQQNSKRVILRFLKSFVPNYLR